LNPDKIRLVNSTFLGNEQRNYYGNEAPDKLNLIWRSYLGKGKTVISKKIGEKEWAGSGWTGQALLVEEENQLNLVIGCFDHHLKKMNAGNGDLIWQYAFDDVIKGTGTLWYNPGAINKDQRLIILQGSRRGLTKDLYSRTVPSFRAVSYFSGQELWRLNVRQTASYSRDVDGSALVINDTAYIGLENGVFTVFSPDPARAEKNTPYIFQETDLFTRNDIIRHGGNLVTESSPARLANHIYITAGSGHVYGYNLKTRQIDWDYYIGSDLDGSPVVTSDSCLIVTIEKQYIEGPGGVMKLDPRRDPGQAVVWFFPTRNDSLLSWAGGVIGTAGINDATRQPDDPFLCVFTGIDGYMYVVDHRQIDTSGEKVFGPDSISQYNLPKLLYKYKLGPSISTPVIIGSKIVAAGYHGLHIFLYDNENNFTLLDRKRASAFESTPVIHNKRIYIGSRDGYFYCFGD
jgi:outer membrane protein assembly factor BamB